MKATQVFPNVIDPEESESGGCRSITGQQGGVRSKKPPLPLSDIYQNDSI